MKPPSTSDDRGESLIELLVTLAIMSTAVVALLGAIGTSIRVSDLHRHQTNAGTHLKAFTEALQSNVAQRPSRYTECGPGIDPRAVYQGFYTLPVAQQSVYEATVVEVRFWDDGSSSFVTACPASGDSGVQQVALRVRTLAADRAAVDETLDVTLRKPCRAANTSPLLDPPSTPVEDDPCA